MNPKTHKSTGRERLTSLADKLAALQAEAHAIANCGIVGAEYAAACVESALANAHANLVAEIGLLD